MPPSAVITNAPLVPNIRHLAALAATVRHGSLTRAAEAVHLTQPALTQAIAGLEARLGLSLFERGATGMAPTAPARRLAARAEAALAYIGSSRVTSTQLRALLALARAGGYAAAAQATGISGAALHRAVADLQYALGHKLVERRGQRVVLTPAGERRVRRFGLAIAELAAGIEEIASGMGVHPRISIGAMPLSRARWLPQALAHFTARNPEATIVVVEGSHAELASALRHGAIDMMLGALRGENGDGLREMAVFADAPMVVMRAGHKLAKRAKLGAEILDFPWILPGHAAPLRQHFEAMIRAMGHEPPRVAIECGSTLTIRQMLLAGEALTLLSPDQVAVELAAGLLVAHAPPRAITRAIGLTTRADWRPTPAQAQFHELLLAFGEGAPKTR